MTDEESYHEIRWLLGANKNLTEIAGEVKRDRNWVQHRMYIAEIGGVIEENYLNRFEPNLLRNRDYIFFNIEIIHNHHKAHLQDKEAKIPFDSERSALKRCWTELSSTKERVCRESADAHRLSEIPPVTGSET